MQQWLARTGRTRGAAVAPQRVYDLGLEWYDTRLDRDWQRRDPYEAARVFSRHGLVGPFWSPG